MSVTIYALAKKTEKQFPQFSISVNMWAKSEMWLPKPELYMIQVIKNDFLLSTIMWWIWEKLEVSVTIYELAKKTKKRFAQFSISVNMWAKSDMWFPKPELYMIQVIKNDFLLSAIMYESEKN